MHGEKSVVASRKYTFRKLNMSEITRIIPAESFLATASQLMEERGEDYDEEGGERSFGKIAIAFNAITGHNITPAEVALLMQILKDVRQWASPRFHCDSANDCVTYSALKAEELSRQYEES